MLRRCLSVSTDPTKQYDVVVAGGGMVGMAFACSLADRPAFADSRIIVLEGGNPEIIQEAKPQYSNRVSSINPASKRLLKNLGVWNDIVQLRVQPVKKLQVWDSCSDAVITYQQPNVEDDVAHIVENEVLISSLLKKLQSYSDRIEVSRQCRIKKYVIIPSSTDVLSPLVNIELEDGRRLCTKLLIGADGPQSLVRKAMGVKYVNWSYDQVAVVATLELAEPTVNIVAWQRFLPTGPIALLPLNERFSSLVWTTTSSRAKQLIQMPEESFIDEINMAFWSPSVKHTLVETASNFLHDVLRNVTNQKPSSHQLPPSIERVEAGSRASFPLGLGHASEYVCTRVALIGDAAHRVHPLAGLGVNMGLADAEVLADNLEKCVYEGADIGTLRHLADYEQLRQRQVVPTMAVIDGLNRLFSTRLPALVMLRTVGLQLTDSCGPIKEQIVARASS